jgi:hypothetical protein
VQQQVLYVSGVGTRWFWFDRLLSIATVRAIFSIFVMFSLSGRFQVPSQQMTRRFMLGVTFTKNKVDARVANQRIADLLLLWATHWG